MHGRSITSEVDMKVMHFCAWCGLVLSEWEEPGPEDEEKESHGICEACEKAMKKEAGID